MIFKLALKILGYLLLQELNKQDQNEIIMSAQSNYFTQTSLRSVPACHISSFYSIKTNIL